MRNLKELIKKRKDSKEVANSFILYIMWMPLLFGVFGVATDSSIATYTTATIQSGLDASTQSALSRAANPGTGENKSRSPLLSKDKARELTAAYYDTNRKSGKNPFIQCQTSGAKAPSGGYSKFVVPPSGCGWTETAFSYSVSGRAVTLNLAIIEKTSTVFMKTIGINSLTFEISSSARTTYEIG